jgi:hypothetical protein
MEETDLHDRVLEANLKADAEWLVRSPVKKFARRLVTHWISAAFLIGLFIAVFVYVIHFVQRAVSLWSGLLMLWQARFVDVFCGGVRSETVF